MNYKYIKKHIKYLNTIILHIYSISSLEFLMETGIFPKVVFLYKISYSKDFLLLFLKLLFILLLFPSTK